MSSFGSQNQLQNSLAPLGKLLKAVSFLTNYNGFNPPSYSPTQRSQKKKKKKKRKKEKEKEKEASSPSKSPVWKVKDSSK